MPISSIAAPGEIKPAATSFLWAIWDIYPTQDVYRPPILSGIEQSLSGLMERAKQYDIRGAENTSPEFNSRLFALTAEHQPVASVLNRSSGTCYLVIWGSMVKYLSGSQPVLERDGISIAQAKSIASEAGVNSPFISSSYARMQIRRNEAIRRHKESPGTQGSAIIQEFLYADHNEKYIGGKSNWKRHRVVRKTPDTIFVDRHPYCTQEHLRRGWQAHIIFTAMIDRSGLEAEGKYYHRTLRTHFFTEKIARSRAGRLFDDGGPFFDPILDLPTNEIQWACGALGLKSWPCSQDTVKRSFARAAMIHHPDRGGDARRFIECKAARGILLSRLGH